MKEGNLSLLEARVRETIGTSPVGDHVTNIVVEADRDDAGSDFLRVILEVTPLDDVTDEDLDAAVQSIEDDLSEIDDRFPSVRFAVAA